MNQPEPKNKIFSAFIRESCMLTTADLVRLTFLVGK